MKLLAIDTSGADCSAAIYDDASESILAARQETIGKGHAEKLMAIIDTVLGEAGLEIGAIGKIGVVVGPGSFTGIRVGVSVARGFGVALGIPLCSVTSLEVLAHGSINTQNPQPILVAMDAKRGQVYLQLFSASGEEIDGPFVMEVDEANAYFTANPAYLVGSGSALLQGADAALHSDHIPIDLVARLASNKAPGKPAPLYLRGPDAKPQSGFAVARK